MKPKVKDYGLLGDDEDVNEEEDEEEEEYLPSGSHQYSATASEVNFLSLSLS